MDVIQKATGKDVSKDMISRRSRQGDEMDLVFSGLEENNDKCSSRNRKGYGFA